MCWLRTRIRNQNKLLDGTFHHTLTENLQNGVGRMSRQKQDRLGDDAAAAGASSTGINGGRGGGLVLGSVGDDGEERSEGIHCCLCGEWIESCDETV